MTARESPARVVGRVALSVAAVAAVGLFHVWSHTRVTTAGYRLGELQRARSALVAERGRLEVEVAALRAPGRLESFARTRLGMAPPAPGAVVAGRAGTVAVAGRAGWVSGRASHAPAPAEPAGTGGAQARRDERIALRERPRTGRAAGN